MAILMDSDTEDSNNLSIEDLAMDDMDMYEDIFDDEERLYSPRHNYKMYLGLYTYDQEHQTFILASTVHTLTFYKYDRQDVLHYLYDYNISRDTKPTLEIMQLHMVPDPIFGNVYQVVLKTHWLRIVQRRWKAIFRERQNILRQRVHPGSRRVLELRGVYPSTCYHLPRLKGMLYDLSSISRFDLNV